MATMLGNCNNNVMVVFKELPSGPDVSTDPLSRIVPHQELYLHRMRELDLAHSVQYTVNVDSIDNLNGRVQAATECVSGAIMYVLGNTERAQQAAAAFRGSRRLETAEEISRRTVKHPGVIHVCKEDPAVHEGLPKVVWETPELDEAFTAVATEYGWNTIADYEKVLLFEHINMLRPAIQQQQRIIRRLVNVLSEQFVISQLDRVLRHQKVPKKIITLICAKVVGLQCHWTTEIPTEWLSEPIKARSSGQHPSCVVVEEPSCSTSSNTSSKGWRLFSVRVAKAVAAAGVTVASMLANRHGA